MVTAWVKLILIGNLAETKTKYKSTLLTISGWLLLVYLILVGGYVVFWLGLNAEVTAQENIDYNNINFIEEEIIIREVADERVEETVEAFPIQSVLFEYVEVVDGCEAHFEGDCLLVRSGPGIDFSIVTRLRNAMVLKIDGKVERDGMTWYRIVFDEVLHYPERVTGDWYVSADFVEVLFDEGEKTIWENKPTGTSSKQIIVDLSEQTLTAVEDKIVYMVATTSTGLEATPTPRGNFTVFKKTPSRYMQGPLPGFSSDQYYDLPGVPWNLYFTHQGAVIHGAYWHNNFGNTHSHGCVNLEPDLARELYHWADLGTLITVQD